MWIRRFVCGLLLAIATCSVLAVPRNFPTTAMRGVLTATMYPQVTINGQVLTLSPGAKIISQQNTIVMHSTLTNGNYVVNYTLDRFGMIDKVWILTPEEQAQTLGQ
jgi:hypothetical protein